MFYTYSKLQLASVVVEYFAACSVARIAINTTATASSIAIAIALELSFYSHFAYSFATKPATAVVSLTASDSSVAGAGSRSSCFLIFRVDRFPYFPDLF